MKRGLPVRSMDFDRRGISTVVASVLVGVLAIILIALLWWGISSIPSDSGSDLIDSDGPSGASGPGSGTCVSKSWYYDGDLDGFGDFALIQSSCVKPSGYVSDSKDCDDKNANVNPSRIEVNNGIDDDCDGDIDESVGSGGGSSGSDEKDLTDFCDGLPEVKTPEGDSECSSELSSSLTNDCSNANDDDLETAWRSLDDSKDHEITFDFEEVVCVSMVDIYSEINSDAKEISISEDGSDWERIGDNIDLQSGDWTGFEGFGEIAARYIMYTIDSEDRSSEISEFRAKVRDIDEDCDASRWYLDSDGDGQGDPDVSIRSCSKPANNYVSNDDDCNDEGITCIEGIFYTAYELDLEYDFFKDNDNYNYNSKNLEEKWLRSKVLEDADSNSNDVKIWVFVLPNGEVYLWSGNQTDIFTGSFRVASIGKYYYEDPARMIDVALGDEDGLYKSALALDQAYNLHARVTGYDENFGGLNEKWLQVLKKPDPLAPQKGWVFILEGGQIFLWNNESGRNDIPRGSELLAILGSEVYSDPMKLVDVSVSGDSIITDPVELQAVYEFYKGDSFHEDWGNQSEKWFRSNTENGRWFFILPDGKVYNWDKKVPILRGSVLVGEIDVSYYETPSTLFSAGEGDGEVITDLEMFKTEYELYRGDSLYEDYGGKDEKWLLSRAKGEIWVYVLPNGEVYKWDSSTKKNLDSELNVLVAQISEYIGDVEILIGGGGSDTDTIITDAYELDQMYNFVYRDDYDDWASVGDKWLRSSNREWFFILVEGTTANVYKWDTNTKDESLDDNGLSDVKNVLVATLSGYNGDANTLVNVPNSDEAGGGNNGGESVAQLAYDLDTQYVFTYNPSNNFLNWAGQNEKWIKFANSVDGITSDKWVFILPSGELRRWEKVTGDPENAMTESVKIGMLDASYYNDPSRLVDVVEPSGDEGSSDGGGSTNSVDTIAYNLDQEYEFSVGNSNYNLDWSESLQEKWIRYNNNIASGVAQGDRWVFILPDGKVYRWEKGVGSNTGDNDKIILESELIGELDASYYEDPSKLIGVVMPEGSGRGVVVPLGTCSGTSDFVTVNSVNCESSHSSGACNNLIDGKSVSGDEDTVWVSNNIPSESNPENVVFDLGSTRCVDLVSMYTYKEGQSFSVEVSNDNSNWVEVSAAKLALHDVWDDTTFNEAVARYVRLVFYHGQPSNTISTASNSKVFVSEVKVKARDFVPQGSSGGGSGSSAGGSSSGSNTEGIACSGNADCSSEEICLGNPRVCTNRCSGAYVDSVEVFSSNCASSGVSGQNLCSKAYDGSTSTYWESSQTNPPHQISLTLKNPSCVAGGQIYSAIDQTVVVYTYPLNGGAEVSVGSFNLESGKFNTITFDERQTRVLKYVFSHDPRSTTVNEIKVRGRNYQA